MKGVTLVVALLSLFLTGIMAMPLCVENGDAADCKLKGTFFEVNCAEKLKFKHATATCFMNDKDEFIILAINDHKLSKRSIVADEQTLFSPHHGGKVLVRRLKRSVDSEQDFKAEVLNAKELKDLLKLSTENPLATNEVSPGTDATATTTNTDDESDEDTVKGVIIIVAHVKGTDNEVTDSKESSLSETGEEDLTEALFGLMLLGAILEELKKHQVENDA